MEPTQIDVYEKSTFSALMSNGHSATHDVYTRGDGAPVVIIQELPGIGQETLRLADKFIGAGFKVVMPHLFGPIGRTSLARNMVRIFCLRKEFTVFKTNKSSPITDWLKALCRKVKDDGSANGVGVIGMCLTGNFAISLMADDSVLAAVASQPSMPFGGAAALHMSDADVAHVSKRIDDTAPIKMLRFEEDWMCSPKKEKSIDAAFNTGGISRIEKHVIPGKGHSVLTIDFVDEVGHPTHKALESVVQYFQAQLV